VGPPTKMLPTEMFILFCSQKDRYAGSFWWQILVISRIFLFFALFCRKKRCRQQQKKKLTGKLSYDIPNKPDEHLYNIQNNFLAALSTLFSFRLLVLLICSLLSDFSVFFFVSFTFLLLTIC
jgi:hypothetical protein